MLDRSQQACKNAGAKAEDHFTGIIKMVGIGSGAQRPIEDFALTRYACFLLAQNGDPAKSDFVERLKEAHGQMQSDLKEALHVLQAEIRSLLGVSRSAPVAKG